MARYFPVSLDLLGRRCLVVGGGNEALKKCQSLLEAGAQVDVLSPVVLPDLTALAAAGRIAITYQGYRPGYLAGYTLVFACTDSASINEAIFQEGRDLGILVNVVDRAEHCDFIMPAVARQGSLTLAITTDGKSPAFAQWLRDRLTAEFDGAHALFLDLLGALRPAVRTSGLPLPLRTQLYHRIVRSPALDRIQAGDWKAVETVLKGILKEYDVPCPKEWSTWWEPAPAPRT